MTTRYFQDGCVLDHVAAAAITSGDIVVMGDSVGIALEDIANGATGAVQVSGVFSVPKVTGEAWAQGDKIGYDASASGFDKTFTTAAGDVSTCGVAAAAAASAAAVGYLLLTPGTGTAA